MDMSLEREALFPYPSFLETAHHTHMAFLEHYEHLLLITGKQKMADLDRCLHPSRIATRYISILLDPFYNTFRKARFLTKSLLLSLGNQGHLS